MPGMYAGVGAIELGDAVAVDYRHAAEACESAYWSLSMALE